MPGLLRGVARTAAIAGTASAVSGRVQRRQAARFAEQDAQTAAVQQQAYEQQAYQQPAPQAAPAEDRIARLEQLGALRAQGVLTEEEFLAEKARLLSS